MNRNVVTVTESTSVQETIEQMIETRRKILPVVDGKGQLVGMVGRSVLLGLPAVALGLLVGWWL